jgi:hypothetical protein
VRREGGISAAPGRSTEYRKRLDEAAHFEQTSIRSSMAPETSITSLSGE